LKIKETLPPLPREQIQITRLKWIPTDDKKASAKKKATTGYYQGAYSVPGTSHYTTVLLRDEWVNYQFDPTFVEEVKRLAIKGTRAQARRLITVPPGNSRDKLELPPVHLVEYTRESKFQQGENSTCLFDEFCSAMHLFGCVPQVESLRTAVSNEMSPGKSLSQANLLVWGDFNTQVNRYFKSVGLQSVKQNNARTVSDLLGCDDLFAIVALLCASDRMEGQHAIAIFDGAIYDANSRYALSKTQESLDWCCGGNGITCTGIHRSYQILPVNRKKIEENMRFVFQTRNENNCIVRGWVASTLGQSILVQFPDGTKRSAKKAEVASFIRLN
jgi:hypothetical protein